MSDEPLLRVEGLVKHFPVTRGVFGKIAGQVRAVDGVSFEIMPGETLGLVGESGCGKSTVGRALLRLIEPSAGKVVFQGKDMATLEGAQLRAQRRDMQVIFQDPMSSLNPRMRVVDIVGEALIEHGLATPEDVRARVVSLLEKVGVSASWIHRYPHEFSGGQRQRIGIARAIALSPKLVVCDEAVSALDVSIRAQVINLLMRLRRELGLSYLFISHDLSVVRHISHRVLVMYLGRVVEQANTKDLFESPAHPYTQALLSAVPVPDPTRRGVRVRLVGDVPSPLAPPSGCHFHTRCPARFARCSVEAPPLFKLEAGHHARCFHAEGLEGNADWKQLLAERIDSAEAALIRDGGAIGEAETALKEGQSALNRERGGKLTEEEGSTLDSADGASPPGAWSDAFSAWDAAPAAPVGKWRLNAAIGVAVLVLLFVGVLRTKVFGPGVERASAQRDLAALDAELRGYRYSVGYYPAELGELGYRLLFVFPEGRALDPWGQPYGYRLVPNGFELSSLGADSVPSTDDLHLGP